MTTYRTLDWVSEHDPRSLDYPIRSLIRSSVPDVPKRWKVGNVLDQGQEGSCVGHGWTTELMASPKPVRLDPDKGHAYAVDVYNNAQLTDEWEGEDYDGTSVLAGAKVIQSRGYMDEYRWAFTVDDVKDAILTNGPVVIGIRWYESMYETRPSGLVEIGGPIVGGHCLTLTAYHPSMRLNGEDWNERFRVFRWRNSWGNWYGRNGDGFIRYEDLRDLLAGDGEACVPVGRHKVRGVLV